MPSGEARLELLLALADDELVLGHRHSEWTGWAPFVEEDVAFSSIAQDEIAHARLLYELAGGLGAPDPDALALGREPSGYRNAVLCELPNGDWAFTVARHLLYDLADDVRLRALAGSSWGELADAARLLLLEEQYHLEHAGLWWRRLAFGPPEAREHGRRGLAEALEHGGSLFAPLQGEEELLREGVLPRPLADLEGEWRARLGACLEPFGLAVPAPAPRPPRGEHAPAFRELWEEMTGLWRAIPGARW